MTGILEFAILLLEEDSQNGNLQYNAVEGEAMERDIAEKQLEEYSEVFADIVNALVFEGRMVCQAENLVSLPTESYHRSESGKLRQRNRDVIKQDERNGTVFLIVGLENQDSYDNTMVIRTMGYDFGSYDRQIKDIMKINRENANPAYGKGIHDDQKLVPVITLVLYFGQEKWKGPKELSSLLCIPEEYEGQIRPFIPDYRLNLIELSGLSGEVRERFTSDFRLVADFIAGQADILQYRELMKDTGHKIKHPQEMLDLLGALGKDRRYKAIKESIIKRSEKEDVTMCMIAEELENKGIEKGIEMGIEKGIEKGIELTLKMLESENYDALKRASVDKKYRNSLFKKYGL